MAGIEHPCYSPLRSRPEKLRLYPPETRSKHAKTCKEVPREYDKSAWCIAGETVKGPQAFRLTTRVSADYRHDEVDVVYGVDAGKAYIPDIFGADTSAGTRSRHHSGGLWAHPPPGVPWRTIPARPFPGQKGPAPKFCQPKSATHGYMVRAAGMGQPAKAPSLKRAGNYTEGFGGIGGTPRRRFKDPTGALRDLDKPHTAVAPSRGLRGGMLWRISPPAPSGWSCRCSNRTLAH